MNEPIRIVDVIAQTSQYSRQVHYSVVLSRQPTLVYERSGQFLTAADDGLYDFLQEVPGSKDAFGGRTFTVDLTDGTTLQCNGQVWSCAHKMAPEPTIEVGIATIKQLRECYVFSGGAISKAKLEAWLEQNTPTSRYSKYDSRDTVESLQETHLRYGGNPIGKQRARTLRQRGVFVWRNRETDCLNWSKSFEYQRARILADIAVDRGSIDRDAVLRGAA